MIQITPLNRCPSILAEIIGVVRKWNNKPLTKIYYIADDPTRINEMWLIGIKDGLAYGVNPFPAFHMAIEADRILADYETAIEHLLQAKNS